MTVACSSNDGERFGFLSLSPQSGLRKEEYKNLWIAGLDALGERR